MDSGADVSLIPTHFVDSRHLVEPQLRRLFAANDTEITVDGQVTVPVRIGKYHMTSTFYASENVDEVILGRDWLALNRVSWDFHTNTVMLNGAPVQLTRRNRVGPHCKRCRVSDDLQIPAHSEAVIPANLIYGSFHDRSPEEHWTTVPSEPVPGLRVARTLISSNHPSVAVRVCNISRSPITLRKGQSISAVQSVMAATTPEDSSVNHPSAEQQRQNIVNGIDPTAPLHAKQQLADLIENYKNVFSYSEYDLGNTDLVHHEIKTGSNPPFRQALRPQPRARLPVIDNLLEDMQSQGIIEPCQSEWSSNIVLVTKKDGTIRFCVDYRKLNAITQKDVYPIPRIDTCLETLSGASWYSTFDLRSGFHQVRVHPRDVNKTTFTCHRGTFRFPRMPFGLCNAPATFQRLMDTVLMGLNFDICLAYLDDIILISKDIQSHLSRLEMLFQRLREAKLKLKPSKCSVMQKSVAFLGYIVSEKGISTDPSKIQAVVDWPTPTNLRQCRAFIGLCQYYRRFVPNFSAIAAPLYDLTKKHVPFVWSTECQQAFDSLKRSLTSADVLALPDDEGMFILDCDASEKSIGAVLSQIQNGEERPICYASQLYDRHQQNYNVTRKELLAMVTFVKKFKQYLLGRPFLVRTDHAALQWLRSTPEPVGQQSRWLEILEEYDFRVEHRAGRLHTNADALSRCVAVTRDETADSQPATSVDWPTIQRNDPELGKIYQLIQLGHSCPTPDSITDQSAEFKSLCAQLDHLKLLPNGTLCRVFVNNNTGATYDQIIVPRPFRKEITDDLHRGMNGGHLGHRRARLSLQKRFFWPGWSSDVRLAKRRCQQCSRYQRPRPYRQGTLQPMVSGEPWERLGIDVTGPHPTSANGNVYILTVIDHFTKWVELFPMRNQEASTVAKILVDRVFCTHGCPVQILSDMGPNFESTLFQELCKIMGVDKIRTSPYRPSTNGNIERFHATMHSMLAKLVAENQRNWDHKLPMVAFAYRTSVQESTKFTPFFLLYGREARIPADLVYGLPTDPDRPADITAFAEEQRTKFNEAYGLVRQHLGTAARRRKHDYDLRAKPQQFPIGSKVWVFVPRRKSGRYAKWQCRYQGPFEVISQPGPVTYVVQKTARSRPWTVHVDKMKPCYVEGGSDSAHPNPEPDIAPEDDPTQRSRPSSTPLTPSRRPQRNTRLPSRYRDEPSATPRLADRPRRRNQLPARFR